MTHRIDPRRRNNLIDAMVLYRVKNSEYLVVDRILELVEANEISLMLPHTVKSEIEHANTPNHVKRRAAKLIYTLPVTLTADEVSQRDKIRRILQGDAKRGKHDSDADHVFECIKYGGYFITKDGRILKRKQEISKIAPIEIVTPTEFLRMYWSFEHITE